MSINTKEREIYFHVGLGKTGTKYLQFDFFPKLKGITYIPMTRYRKSVEIIKSSNDVKFLVSREFDRQFYKEIEWFATYFKDVKAIMVLRRQDKWILSQYKRYLKNGYTKGFDNFFNLEDTGFFKIKDMMFYDKINALEKYFHNRPLVLMYDELAKSPFSFLDKISKYTKTTYNAKEIRLKRRHSSYSPKQLKFIYLLSKKIDLRPKDNKLRKYLFIYPIRYPLLYLANYVPDKATPNIELIPSKEQLEEIRSFFEDDWNKCLQYSSSFFKDLK